MNDVDNLLTIKRELHYQLKDAKILAQMSLREFAKKSLLLSGQQRGPLWESYLIARKYFERKSKRHEDCGDLYKQDNFFELKTKVLTSNRIDAGILFTTGQIRLYQPVAKYLFITTNEDTGSLIVLAIPADRLRLHYLNGEALFCSSHITGASKDKDVDIKNISLKKEWSLELNLKKYDWYKYEVTEEQLYKI